MAKRDTSSKKETPKTPAKAPAKPAAAVAATSPVRKTVAPKAASTKSAAASIAPATITHELISERAYHISRSGYGGSEDENWHRAERELRDGV